ncbi:hypothetical protein AV530_004390 [Patagioenas fasciata monilis]|uniref:Uncharacterized protein n=1 Tax=Patagioenas fasciata monilis TaxID=372326 RepID=A0A1V4J2Q5_PATFA|nr:hypothetical protein AV530_004390 [Patagioenas fasciata monilis]
MILLDPCGTRTSLSARKEAPTCPREFKRHEREALNESSGLVERKEQQLCKEEPRRRAQGSSVLIHDGAVEHTVSPIQQKADYRNKDTSHQPEALPTSCQVLVKLHLERQKTFCRKQQCRFSLSAAPASEFSAVRVTTNAETSAATEVVLKTTEEFGKRDVTVDFQKSHGLVGTAHSM